jgi:hypothetical protein
VARGGDGYLAFRDAKQLIRGFDGPLIVNTVLDYVQKAGTLRVGVEGRIVFK